MNANEASLPPKSVLLKTKSGALRTATGIARAKGFNAAPIWIDNITGYEISVGQTLLSHISLSEKDFEGAMEEQSSFLMCFTNCLGISVFEETRNALVDWRWKDTDEWYEYFDIEYPSEELKRNKKIDPKGGTDDSNCDSEVDGSKVSSLDLNSYEGEKFDLFVAWKFTPKKCFKSNGEDVRQTFDIPPPLSDTKEEKEESFIKLTIIPS